MRWICLRYQDSSPVESWRSGQAEWNKSILMWVASTENCLGSWSSLQHIMQQKTKKTRISYFRLLTFSVLIHQSTILSVPLLLFCARLWQLSSWQLSRVPMDPTKTFYAGPHSPKNNGKLNDSRWFQSHLCSIASLYKSWTLTDFWAPRKSPNFQTRALPSLHPHALILFLMKLGTIYLLDPSKSSPHSPFLIPRGSSLWSTTLIQCVFKRHRARISVITPCYLPWMQGVRVMRAKMRN